MFASEEEKPKSRNDEFGWDKEDKTSDENRTKNLGKKINASLLSAVFPGAGQWYVGNRSRAYLMGGIEVGIWGAFLVFDHMGDGWRDSAYDYAGVHAGATGDHNDAYWTNVGTYMSDVDFDDARNRELRATLGEDFTPVFSASADSWQWANDEHRRSYLLELVNSHDSYDRRDYMLIFALVNRVVSMVDAVLGVKNMDGVLESSFMGLDVELAVVPELPDPVARWTVSRRF